MESPINKKLASKVKSLEGCGMLETQGVCGVSVVPWCVGDGLVDSSCNSSTCFPIIGPDSSSAVPPQRESHQKLLSERSLFWCIGPEILSGNQQQVGMFREIKPLCFSRRDKELV